MEHIYIDSWELSLITSASGSWYFILLIDEASFFQTVEFLREVSWEYTRSVEGNIFYQLKFCKWQEYLEINWEIKYVFYIEKGSMFKATKRQETITTSATEIKYIVVSHTV